MNNNKGQDLKQYIKENDNGSKAMRVLDLMTPVIGEATASGPDVTPEFTGQIFVDEGEFGPAVYICIFFDPEDPGDSEWLNLTPSEEGGA